MPDDISLALPLRNGGTAHHAACRREAMRRILLLAGASPEVLGAFPRMFDRWEAARKATATGGARAWPRICVEKLLSCKASIDSHRPDAVLTWWKGSWSGLFPG